MTAEFRRTTYARAVRDAFSQAVIAALLEAFSDALKVEEEAI